MSYILDALKRADAERGQTVAPTPTEFQPVAMPVEGQAARRSRLRLIGLVVLALALCIGLAVAWRMWRATPDQVRVAPAPSQSATSQTASLQTDPSTGAPARNTPPTPTGDEITSPPESQEAPAAKAVSARANAAAPEQSAKAPVLPILAKAPPPKSAAPASATDTPPATPAAPPAPSTTPAVTPSATPSVPPASAQDRPTAPPPLTAAQRAALPSITISGSSYSSNPAHRILIANGKVVKEGAELSPGLTLEAIGPHSAIFNQRGTRFNVNY
jgi:general secretion pathway protein B